MDKTLLGIIVLIIFFSIWGLVVMKIAHSKGRKGWGYFLLGFFLSWIGLIIVLVMKDTRTNKNSHKLFCEKCGQPQSIKNKNCWSCGAPLNKIKIEPEIGQLNTK